MKQVPIIALRSQHKLREVVVSGFPARLVVNKEN